MGETDAALRLLGVLFAWPNVAGGLAAAAIWAAVSAWGERRGRWIATRPTC